MSSVCGNIKIEIEPLINTLNEMIEDGYEHVEISIIGDDAESTGDEVSLYGVTLEEDNPDFYSSFSNISSDS